MKKLIFTIIILLQAISLFSQSPDSVKQAHELGLQGVQLVNEGKYNKAIEIFDEAMKLAPDSIQYPYEKALAYYQKKVYDSAIIVLEPLLEHKDVNEYIYQVLGNCYDYQRKRESAAQTYKRGLEKFPNSGRLYMELGIVYMGSERYSEAMSYWEKGVELEPSFPNNYYFLCEYYSRLHETVWVLLYGEIFMILTDNNQRLDDMSKLLYKTYSESFYTPKDSGTMISFTRVKKLMGESTGYDGLTFELSFEKAMTEAAKSLLPKDTNILSIEQISKIRKRFINIWFKNKLEQKFPNIIFDWHKKLIDKEFFDVYNYWLMKEGNKDEFKELSTKNKNYFELFTRWIPVNILKVDNINKFYRFQY